MRDQAAELMEIVFNYFDGRKGFDDWFECLSYQDQRDLRSGLTQVLRRELKDKLIEG